MKVIDLLNKIANGEDVPKRIKYCGVYYKYDDYDYFREDIDDDEDEPLSYWIDFSNKDLNDEIEIIEDTPKEDKKIEKVNTYVICDNDFNSKGNFSLKATEIIDRAFEEYSHKLNKIIDRLNGEDNDI